MKISELAKFSTPKLASMNLSAITRFRIWTYCQIMKLTPAYRHELKRYKEIEKAVRYGGIYNEMVEVKQNEGE